MILKRLFDLSVCIVAAPVIVPVALVAVVVVKCSSPGPVFYRGRRMGIHAKPFYIYKFRTMYIDAERTGGMATALNDRRIPPGCDWLRRFKIDELPQFINVLKGEMSVVGPRPEIEALTRHYTEEQRRIFSVRPGITDFASVKFINLGRILGEGDVDEKFMREVEPEKTRLRLKYVDEQSFWTDAKILIMTVGAMLRLPSLWNSRKDRR